MIIFERSLYINQPHIEISFNYLASNHVDIRSSYRLRDILSCLDNNVNIGGCNIIDLEYGAGSSNAVLDWLSHITSYYKSFVFVHLPQMIRRGIGTVEIALTTPEKLREDLIKVLEKYTAGVAE